jgi:hypothetical protein
VLGGEMWQCGARLGEARRLEAWMLAWSKDIARFLGRFFFWDMQVVGGFDGVGVISFGFGLQVGICEREGDVPSAVS